MNILDKILCNLFRNRIVCFMKYSVNSEFLAVDISKRDIENNIEHDEGVQHRSRKSLESIYYIENGLRKVYPYYYRHATYCKSRWVNKKLLDVFSSEFALYTSKEFENRILNGVIKVNGKTVELNYRLKNNDYITAVVHRHELPVLQTPLNVVYEDENLLVINKPPSIPVHPCGLYRHNTIINILANEKKKDNLFVVHRLDRLSSGVLILSKKLEMSHLWHADMSMCNIKKNYICRVEGNFPEGKVICNKPVKYFRKKLAFSAVDSTGKCAVTEFEKLSYNGKSSVVLCKPYTGRTHQIRVHLQYIGHPITNDPIYNNPAFGIDRCKGGIREGSKDKIITELFQNHVKKWCILKNSSNVNIATSEDYLKKSNFSYYCNYPVQNLYEKNVEKINQDKSCFFCTQTVYGDPVQTDFGIFLHALKYETKNWEFKTELPLWASENWVET